MSATWGAYTAVCDEDLGQRARVASRLATHCLDGVHRGAGSTGAAGEHGRKAGRVEGRRSRGRRHGWWGDGRSEAVVVAVVDGVDWRRSNGEEGGEEERGRTRGRAN